MKNTIALLVILLGAFIYVLFWNQYRKPYCTSEATTVGEVNFSVDNNIKERYLINKKIVFNPILK